MHARIGMTIAAVMALSAPAFGQNLARHVFGSGGGESEGGGVSHFGVLGTGMAVGYQDGDSVARHGFLPGQRTVDETPPVFDPEPDDLGESTEADRCAALVNIPAIRATDNQDDDVSITVTLQTRPPQDIDPDGEQVELPIGSYDVVAVAVDDAGNEARTSFRIDVADGVPPQFIPVPEDDTVEATSPAGTVYEINFICADACDPNPVSSTDPNILRFPLGVTEVDVVCEDANGNENTETVTITVRDTQPPTLMGAVDDLEADCNGPDGATVEVPQLVWRDNGTSAADLEIELIVDPGPNQRRFRNVPEVVTLAQGDHVLRFVATDESGNQAAETIGVTVNDGGEPLISIRSAPEDGWLNDANVQVVFAVSDGCGAGADFDVELAPPPANLQQNGNVYTATYNQEGRYALEITATDGDGDEANESSIAFGIDRTAPEPVVRVPTQLRVANGNPRTYPLFAMAERLALDVGGEEAADGVASGIKRVTVTLDPAGDNRLLADVEYLGNGIPVTGDRVVSNIGCALLDRQNGGVDIRDGYCNRDEEMDLREIPLGTHELLVRVEDFAGNAAGGSAYFFSGDLHTGTPELLARVGPIIGDAGQPAEVRTPLQFAALALGRARDLSELKADTDYDSPVFMGTALRGAQDATVKLVEALGEANGGTADIIREAVNALQRFSASDVELLLAHVINEGRGQRPPFLLNAAETDTELTEASLEAVTAALGNEQYNAAAAATLDGAFFVKSLYSEWMMDYTVDLQPNALEAVSAEYARGRDLLTAIVDEINVYLTLDVKPAEGEMRTIRDQLTIVVDALDLVATEGFDGIGLSDRAYLEALLLLRDTANRSNTAANGGVWVRNYQWTMMQIVRFMTQMSVNDAEFSFGQGRQDWPMYALSNQYIEDGVGLLDDRRVQAVNDLYGLDENSLCLIIAVYHCDFLTDEGRDDRDEAYPEEDTPEYCWDRMYRPSEWDDAPAGNLRPECRYYEDGDIPR